MKFIELDLPRNTDNPNLPDKILINLEKVVEIFVVRLDSKLKDERNHSHGLYIDNESQGKIIHGTKSDCERGYEVLRNIINTKKTEGDGIEKFVFPPPNADDSESGN